MAFGDSAVATTYPLVTRNDQLSSKASKKDARRQKVAENKKNKRHKKGKQGGKTSKTKNAKKTRNTKRAKKTRSSSSQGLLTSPSKRKREVLKRASAAVGAVEVEQDRVPSKTTRTRAKPVASSSGVESSTKRPPTTVAKSKAVKPAGKAKAKAKVTKETTKNKSKEQSMKPAAKSKTKKGKKDSLPEENPKFHNQVMIDDFLEFARSVGGKGVDPKNPSFKKHVRSELDELEWTRLNVYWSKAACGVKAGSHDIHYFGWTASCAEPSYVAAIAVKCAHLAVPCFALLRAPKITII